MEINYTETIIEPGYEVKTLCWCGGGLYDWASGWHYPGCDGETNLPRSYGYRFDGALSSPGGVYVALLQRFGTKGIILKEGELLREINRSYYKADATEYPLAFIMASGERTAVVHCPREYNRLEIEDAVTGEPLPGAVIEEPHFFHSHLMVSPDGRYLLSAGWYWHPLDELRVYDIEMLLSGKGEKARVFDSGHMAKGLEVTAAAFTPGNDLIFATGGDMLADDDGPSMHPFRLNSLVCYDLGERSILSSSPLGKPSGLLMACDGYVIDFTGHPAAIDCATGKLLARWSHLNSGDRLSCISCGSPVPVLALDPCNARFALVQDKRIHLAEMHQAEVPLPETENLCNG